MNWTAWLLVFLGGGIGSVLRFSMSLVFKNMETAHMAWATFSSNLVATGILGWVVFKIASPAGSSLYLFFAIGLCGGFSTFSTFSFETVGMLREGHYGIAAINVMGSMAACIILLIILSKIWK